ncbi:transposase [Streptacidiphilus sp. PB12-B1b]|uniref:transposase n=1 Tax=Streptacidiphilus sp. PB12-B1b TaxID=2705012 RepID=UPI0015FB64BC|nr:transposase [Streptacidiphilus sp. PB12-B1b]QMU76811.1 transposase [Streptacidiphilus sp. PB12-B1b]
MLSWDEYTEAVELRRQGWSIARIAQRLGRDRKTVRSYLAGERTPGSRRPVQDDALRFLPYCRLRLEEDPHLPAATLFDEITSLGYPGGYSTFTRALRRHHVRPPCERCQARTSYGDSSGTPQPAGEAIQFDWLELPGPPPAWGCGSRAHMLLGLTRSGRWRGALAETEELPHLVEAMDHVMRRLGGSPRCWQFDRMPAVYCQRTERATPEFAEVADYYGVQVEFCPQDAPRRAECLTLRHLAHRWWAAVAEDAVPQDAQNTLDQVAAHMDLHCRSADATDDASTATDGLRQLPAQPFPVQVRAERVVSPQSLVHFRGNSYALPHHLPGAVVEVRHRLDETHLSIATAGGAVIARYRIAPRGAGLQVAKGATITLDRHANTPATHPEPCRRRKRRPTAKNPPTATDDTCPPGQAPPLAPPPPAQAT